MIPCVIKDALSSGEANIVIGFDDLIDHGLERVKIAEDHYSCITSVNSLIADEIRSLKDLENFPHVSVENKNHQFTGTIDSFLAAHEVSIKIITVLPCYTSLYSFLNINDVVAFIPSALVSGGRFRALDFGSQPESFEVVAAWHKRASHNRFHKWILETIANP